MKEETNALISSLIAAALSPSLAGGTDMRALLRVRAQDLFEYELDLFM
jgi:hypothetical protein